MSPRERYLTLSVQLLAPLMRADMSDWDVECSVQTAQFAAAALIEAAGYPRPEGAPLTTSGG